MLRCNSLQLCSKWNDEQKMYQYLTNTSTEQQSSKHKCWNMFIHVWGKTFFCTARAMAWRNSLVFSGSWPATVLDGLIARCWSCTKAVHACRLHIHVSNMTCQNIIIAYSYHRKTSPLLSKQMLVFLLKI